MSGTLTIFGALVRQGLQVMLAYRGAMMLWAIWGIASPLVTLAVWTTAAGMKPIAGYTRDQFATYFILAMVMNHFTANWDMEVFGWLVREGRLSAMLLRPMLPIWQAIADNIGFKLLTGVVVAPAWLALGLLVDADWSIVSWQSLALAVPATALAAGLTFIWGYALAMIAFWTQKNSAINQLYWSLAWFLGGRIAPLAVLPAGLRAAAYWLPFHTMFAFPIETAMGRQPPETIAINFALQIFWLVAGIIVWRLAWRAGIRQYSAVGA